MREWMVGWKRAWMDAWGDAQSDAMHETLLAEGRINIEIDGKIDRLRCDQTNRSSYNKRSKGLLIDAKVNNRYMYKTLHANPMRTGSNPGHGLSGYWTSTRGNGS